jgi:hypothetical protein
MGLIKYLRRHRKTDDRPYTIGGTGGILLALILGIFSLAVLDGYLLRSSNLAAVISSVLVDLTNGDRANNQIGGLTISPVLTQAAQAKANDMAAKGYFAHVSPDGKNSWYWFKQAGYQFYYAGENLAVDFGDSTDVERAWMNSPAHRANILDGHFTEIGIATAQGMYQGHPTTFVVQMFGTPAEAQEPIATVVSPQSASQPATATTKPKPVPAASSSIAIATTTPVAPTTVLGATTVVHPAAKALPQASWWAHLVASPRVALEDAYYALGLVLLALLIAVTGFEFRQHHVRHVVAALGLLVLMVSLFAVADSLIFSAPTLASNQGQIPLPEHPQPL